MKDLRTILMGLAPALAPIFIFTFYPVFYAIYVSLFRFNLKYPEQYGFIGFQNYVEMTQTYYFQYSLRSTAIFAIMAIPVIVLGSLFLALLITRRFKGAGFLQWLVLIPWAIPYVVSGIVWKWIFDSAYGIFNDVLYKLGLISQYIPWVTLPIPAMIILLLAFTWVTLPMPTLLFMAGIQSIPQELYEAAWVDGAKAFSTFRSITLTWIRPIALINVIYTTLMSIWMFDLIYVITQGGPADFTALISFYTYNEMFTFLNFGRASALSVFVLIIGIALIYAYFRALRIGALRLRA
ncbi:MAG: sugar ABC transporter permease [Candidatus Bathyarchaeia archaeon]